MKLPVKTRTCMGESWNDKQRMGYLKKMKSFSASSATYERLTPGDEDQRARKGYVPVLVGQEKMAMERVLVPTKLIDHPYIVSLLELSAHEFGYQQQGLLQIPFDAHSFKAMVSLISRGKQSAN